MTGDEEFVEPEARAASKEPPAEKTSGGLASKIIDGMAMIAIIVAIIALIWIIISV